MSTNFDLIKNALKYLPQRDRRIIFWLIPFASMLAILDLIGVVLLGVVGTLAFKTISNQTQPTRVEILIQEFSPIKLFGFNLLVALTLIAIFTLISKNVSQAALNFKLVKFWSRIESDLASRVFDFVVRQEIHQLTRYKYSEYQYALTTGTNRYVIGILSGFVGLISDLFSTILLCLIALLASPASFFSAGLFFGLIYFFTNTKINEKAHDYGRELAEVSEDLNEHVLEDFQGMREIKIFSREKEILEQFSRKKIIQAKLTQRTVWLNSIIRYLLEISMLLVGMIIMSLVIFLNDARHAITIVTLFIAIGYRLIPNIQRIQNSIISFRNAKGVTLKLFNLLEESACHKELTGVSHFTKSQANLAKIEVHKISFSYDSAQAPTLTNIDFVLASGSRLAIVGPSGSGKSTLLDLLTHVKAPLSGEIVFEFTDGTRNQKVIPRIGYVSQECILFGDTLYEMIAFRADLEELEKDQIARICNDLNLTGLLDKTRADLRADGTNLSGGEKQRIALARALFSKCSLMVLDEPTSALDQANREKVILELESRFKDVTCLIVTHDPEVLDTCTHVLVLDRGKQVYFGTLEEYKILKRSEVV